MAHSRPDLSANIQEKSVASKIISTGRKVVDYFLGDTLSFITGKAENELRNRAFEDKANSIGIMRLGPFLNIAVIQQNDDPNKFSRQLKAFMEIPEADARTPYELFNRLTRAEFILANNGKSAIKLHKDFARYLKPQLIREETIKTLYPLFKDLFDKDINLTHETIIKAHVNNIFSRILLGVEATPELYQIIESLLQDVSLQNMLLPKFIVQHLPAIRNKRTAIDAACREFVRQKIKDIADMAKQDKSNLLLDAIKKVYSQDKDLTVLNPNEINSLADDPGVRNAIFSLFAVSNTATVIAKTLLTLPKNDSRVDSLYRSLYLQYNTSPDPSNLPEQHRATLHALYSWGVLNYSEFSELYRYTRKTIVIDGRAIPAGTLIRFELNELKKSCNSFGHMFDESGNLTYTLGQGRLAPFGVGARKCPGATAVGIVGEYLIMTAVKLIGAKNGATLIPRSPSNVNNDLKKVLPDKKEEPGEIKDNDSEVGPSAIVEGKRFDTKILEKYSIFKNVESKDGSEQRQPDWSKYKHG